MKDRIEHQCFHAEVLLYLSRKLPNDLVAGLQTVKIPTRPELPLHLDQIVRSNNRTTGDRRNDFHFLHDAGFLKVSKGAQMEERGPEPSA